MLQARLSLQAGAKQQALGLAQRAVDTARSVHTGDRVADAFVVARAYRILGDIQHDLGNADGARLAWTTALAAIPVGLAEQPDETAQRASLLQRLGRTMEAHQLTTKLEARGYRDPELSKA